MHQFIFDYLSDFLAPSQFKIIYGGSVNVGNFTNILNLPKVDGVLVGGVSLKPLEFKQIIEFNPVAQND